MASRKTENRFRRVDGFQSKRVKLMTLMGFLVSILSGVQAGQENMFNFATDHETAIVTGYNGLAGDMVIPARIAGLPVAGIGEGAFSQLTLLTSITIPDTVSNIALNAFCDCSNLTCLFFYGDAPSVEDGAFAGVGNATAYYLPGRSGWTDSWAGLAAKPWDPIIQSSGSSFGVRDGQFKFNVVGSSDLTLSVLASPSLINPAWKPVQTLVLSNGLACFSQPLPANATCCFYTLGFPVPQCPVLPHPVLHWKLNEGKGTDVADSSGNGYHAVITGSPLPFWIDGPNGVKAISCVSNLDYSCANPFVGTGQVICSNYVTQLDQATHASLCAWMVSTNFGDYCSCGFGQSYMTNFMIDFTSDEQYVYVVCANGALNTFRYWVGYFPEWHFFCLTYDGTQPGVRTRLYIDGQLKATQTGSEGAPDTLADAVALGYPSIASNVYDTVTGGAACDMRVFDVTLTPEQVMALYLAGAK